MTSTQESILQFLQHLTDEQKFSQSLKHRGEKLSLIELLSGELELSLLNNQIPSEPQERIGGGQLKVKILRQKKVLMTTWLKSIPSNQACGH